MENFRDAIGRFVGETISEDESQIQWAPRAKTAATEVLCSQLQLLATDLEAFAKYFFIHTPPLSVRYLKTCKAINSNGR